MTHRSESGSKITRPVHGGVLSRERLFDLLDRRMGRPVTWISAPAGSGKTTLVTSYLESRELPCLWYQVDRGDADIASFFYFMSRAAANAEPRKGSALPLLRGHYFYGDYCAGFVRSFRLENGEATDEATWDVGSIGQILSFGVDASNELYVLTSQGTVFRFN